MMPRTAFPDFRNALYLLLISHSFYPSSFCEDNIWWCNEKLVPEKSFHVLNGRHFSLSIPQEDPLLSTQSLVWTKGESTWEKRHNDTLEFTGGNVSFDVTRYDLIEDTNGTLILFISFVGIEDMGKHVLSVNNGPQILCTVLILNLTVEFIEPTCLTIFHNERNTVQMTCQWLQVIEGEQAYIVDAGNHVLYVHEALNINVDGRFNLTNKFIVYIDPRDIFDGKTLPEKCVILNHKRNEIKTCGFPPVNRYTIQNGKTDNVTLQCCTANKNISFTWWYKVNDELMPITFTEDISLTGLDHILFICGEEENISNSMLLYSIGSVNVGMGSFCTISVSDRNSFSNSTNDKPCRSIRVNVKRNTSESTTSEETNPNQVTTSNVMQKDSTTNKSENTSKSLVVPWTVVSAVALSLASCMCFIHIRGFYRRRVKLTRNVGTISSTIDGDDATESLLLTNISLTRPRPRNNVPTDTLAVEQHCTSNAIMRSCEEIEKGLPNFSLKGESEAVDNKCITHNTKSHERKNLSFKQYMHETRCISAGTADNIAIRGAQPTEAIPSTPYQDSTYCSLDDVKDNPSNTGKVSPMSFRSSPHPSDGQTDCSNLYNVIRDKRPYAVERKDGRHDATANRSGSTRNVDELYAKPDMSRKTKTTAALESDYDDPRVPGDDFYRTASHQGMNNSQIYSNSVATPTDEMNRDGKLYMNASGNLSL